MHDFVILVDCTLINNFYMWNNCIICVLQLIFSGEYTKAMSKDWHSGHFCCWQCDESLTGQRYVLRDDHPYCVKCYESVFANGCEECSKIIGIDSKVLIASCIQRVNVIVVFNLIFFKLMCNIIFHLYIKIGLLIHLCVRNKLYRI